MNTGVHVIPTLLIGVWFLGLAAEAVGTLALTYLWPVWHERDHRPKAVGTVAVILGALALLLAFLYYVGALD